MVLSADTVQVHMVVLRDGRRLLAEAEVTNRFMFCVSYSLFANMERQFPGFSAIFSAKLRSLGLDPYTSLATNPIKFVNILKQLFGGADLALRYLRRILPRDKVYDEVVMTLLRGDGEDKTREALELIAVRYKKDIEKVCNIVAY